MSWNTKRLDVWGQLAAGDVDVALLQEAVAPGPACPWEVLPNGDDRPWGTSGWEKRTWRTAVVRVSDRVALAAVPTVPLDEGTGHGELGVSRFGSLMAADVLVDGARRFTAVSVYAAWDSVLSNTRTRWADSSAHRILADLSPLLWSQRDRPVIVAGDWNLLFGYGEHGEAYAARRYATVFAHAEALELVLLGPFRPNGRQADPWPDELPSDSRCVPTYYRSGQAAETATRQLDFVFASKSIADRVTVRALNEPAEWGPSDHCRVLIDVDD